MSEILAPLGGLSDLPAALNTGADAVYLGLSDFSARKNAENFSVEDLKTACTECHLRGVKVYAALNTLVYDSETENFAQCVKSAAECGVDGLIIQDIGAAEIAKRVCPKLPRHASTQMTLNSAAGVNAAQQLGFCRAVIGRELSLEQIRHISENTGIELEVFVHGALCVCISGQCYMSSIFGGRSGSRGLCAQPCRLDFTCGGRHSVISLKDSSLVPHLKELDDLGIASLKIEGRMKRPEYIACAVDACRRSLDGKEYDYGRLSGIFSRGGLTDGYFTGRMDDMQGTRSREDVENSAKALNGIKALYKAEYPRIRADIHTVLKAGEPAYAGAVCGDISAAVQGEVPQPAVSAPLTVESVCGRMSKLGGTQFCAGEVTADVGEGLNLSASALNSLRRVLVEKLSEAVLAENTPDYSLRELTPPLFAVHESAGLEWRAEVYSAEQLRQALELPFGLIYAPMRLLDGNTPGKDRIAVIPPFVLSDCEDEVRENLRKLRAEGFTRGMAQTLGHALLLREEGFKVHGGHRMNVINSYAAGVCGDLGFEDITLSFEGTASQLAEILSPIPRGIVAYGRLPLMIMRRCPVSGGKPCGRVHLFNDGGKPCGECIADRRGNKMPVLCGGNSVEILNPDMLIMSDRRSALEPFDFAVLKFTDEREVKPVLDMYLSNGKPSGALTRGLYFRGAE